MQFSFAQEKTVTGTVTDGSLPLSGANVRNSAGGGVSTDADGKFAIKAKAGDKLTVSYKGYETKIINVGAANNYSVKLSAAVEELKEVLITTAVGIKKKKEALTSTQQVVGAKELTQAQAPNVIQSMAGKVSGLVINTVANGVNPTTKITLRGNRTLTGSNDALVVIDNAISSAAVLAQLPPEIVESVNVIKGAQGAALYGSQGLNGAIIVTTKRGSKTSKMKVTLNSNIDFENVAYMPERQMKYGQGWEGDAFDAGDGNGNTTHIPWENGAWGPAFDDPMFAGTLQPTGLPQADGTFIMAPWQGIKDNTKKFFNTGTVLQTGISLNMGGEDSYAAFSANRQETNFVVKDDNLKRNSFLLKMGKKLGKFSIDGNINYINSNTTQTSSDLFFELMQTASNIPVERFNHGMNEHHWTVYYQNPYWMRDHIRFNSSSNVYNGILNLGYKINKNIDVTYLANLRFTGSESDSHADASFVTPTDYTAALTNAGYTYNGLQSLTYGDLGGHDTTSSYYQTTAFGRNFYGDLIFNFNYDLTDKWNLKFNIGNNIQDSYSRSTQVGGDNLETPGWYHINNVLNLVPNSQLNNSTFRSRVFAVFANADLSYKDYLFLNVTNRVESTSVLYFGGLRGQNLQGINLVDGGSNYFNYPSVGLSFMPLKAFNVESKFVNYAKLYANFVSVKNTNAIGTHANDYVGVIPTGFPFGSLASYNFDRTATFIGINPETVNTKEIGANFEFFADANKIGRLGIDASFYVQDTNNLITQRTTSAAPGLTSYLANIGDIQNKGYEIDVTLRPFTGNFKWEAKAGYTTYKTKVLRLDEGVNSINLQSNTFVGIFADVGEEFPLIKGTTYVRDPQGNVVVDASGNPLRNSTFSKLGKANPDYVLNLSNTFEYKGFRLTAVADYRTGHSIYSETMRNLAWSGHLIDSAEFDRSAGYVYPNSVQQTSPGVYTANTTPVGNNVGGGYAGVLAYYSGNFDRTGEALVIDATTFRIRELALSYDLPKKLFNNTGVSGLRIGVNARNPFVWFSSANRNYNDPEQTNTTGVAQGIASIGRYPITRTVGFNINLTF